MEKYEILRNTAGTDEDKLNFHYTKKSLETLGLTADEVSFVFRIIATVLKMGNFVFVPVTNIDGTEGCQVSNDYGELLLEILLKKTLLLNKNLFNRITRNRSTPRLRCSNITTMPYKIHLDLGSRRQRIGTGCSTSDSLPEYSL